jgi:hypothetical protein
MIIYRVLMRLKLMILSVLNDRAQQVYSFLRSYNFIDVSLDSAIVNRI